MHLLQSFRQAAEGATKWRLIQKRFCIDREPGRFFSDRNKNPFRVKAAQEVQLPPPKRLGLKDDCRFVPAHPPRTTASEKDGGKSHADNAITWTRPRELTLCLAATRFRAMVLS